MKGYFIGNAFFPDLLNQSLCKSGLHVTLRSFHLCLGTEHAVEITYIGKFYMHPLKRNFDMPQFLFIYLLF
jgi:hypothetical protein